MTDLTPYYEEVFPQVPRTRVANVEELPLDRVQFDLVDSFDKASEFFRWLSEDRNREVLASDTESGGLVHWRDKLRLVQFGDTEMGWAIPWDLWGGVALDALDRYTGPLAYHNAKYDVLVKEYWSAQAGRPWKAPWDRIHDTLTLGHLDDSTRTKKLKLLGDILVDPRISGAQTVMDTEMTRFNWDWATIPIVREGAGSSYWIYGALDPVITAHLFIHDDFRRARTVYKNAYDLEIATLQAISAMEAKGAHVDLAYCRKMMELIADYSAQLRAWVRKFHGVDNATSNQQCIARFEELNRTITRRTKGGNKSLDKEQLQLFLIGADLANQAEWEEYGLDKVPGNNLARAILDLRRGEKFVGPYFSNFERYADPNGYLHPTIWPLGARTSRMSITEPALQTMPRKDPTVRDAILPSEGNALVTVDADQIEMRLTAHFSRDEGLREAFMSGGDFFSVIASALFETQIMKKDPRRQHTKNSLYGKAYGAGNEKIALTAGVPVYVVDRVMAEFDAKYPRVRHFQNEVINAAKAQVAAGERPSVTTPTGRRLYGDEGKEYALVNYRIQSHAAELLKQGICDIHAAGIGGYLILPVHDELVLDVPRDQVDEVKVVLETTLNNLGRDYFVPLTWSAEVMHERWGDKYRETPQAIAA